MEGDKPAQDTKTEPIPASDNVKEVTSQDLAMPAPVIKQPPPSLKEPVMYNSALGFNVYYSKHSQEYWAETISTDGTANYTLFIKVEKQLVSKTDAKKILRECNNFDDLCAKFPSSFPNIKKSPNEQIIPTALIYINAVHDSVKIKRNTGETSIARFFTDKRAIGQLSNFIFMFREDYVTGCPCSVHEICGSVVYCKACSTYRIQEVTPQAGLVYRGLLTVGKLSVDPTSARTMIMAMCTGDKLDMQKSLIVMANMFRLAKFQNIPLPVEQIVYWTLRDSLFMKFPDVSVSWYDQFFTRPYTDANQPMNGVVAMVGIARLGLAIATLGMIS
ncbi:hypothetical protein VHEMI10155 [[Torrubiella] hemipterigena]|uniref:Uncharacterized protein n=1 Tax=[Torrubiella] hemipterigena TaxID=1531966 RepID=A0A0A1TC53_9HYPO|nr:hypothetical protein VHEMI10155 [[Torrubiella] hemipterigena]